MRDEMNFRVTRSSEAPRPQPRRWLFPSVSKNDTWHSKTNTENAGDRARSLLRDVQTGKLEANSSALTFDELVWAVRGTELPRMQSPLGRHS